MSSHKRETGEIRIMREYDACAYSYERRSRKHMNIYVYMMQKFTSEISRVSPDFKAHFKLKILDLGTGTGRAISILRERFNQYIALIIGVDISQNMIKIAKCRAKDANVSFILCSAKNLPFRNDLFDVVISVGMFEYQHDLKEYFDEAYRVLREGGQFIFNIWNESCITAKVILQASHIFHSIYLTPRRGYKRRDVVKILRQSRFLPISVNYCFIIPTVILRFIKCLPLKNIVELSLFWLDKFLCRALGNIRDFLATQLLICAIKRKAVQR